MEVALGAVEGPEREVEVGPLGGEAHRLVEVLPGGIGTVARHERRAGDDVALGVALVIVDELAGVLERLGRERLAAAVVERPREAHARELHAGVGIVRRLIETLFEARLGPFESLVRVHGDSFAPLAAKQAIALSEARPMLAPDEASPPWNGR